MTYTCSDCKQPFAFNDLCLAQIEFPSGKVLYAQCAACLAKEHGIDDARLAELRSNGFMFGV